MISDVTDMVIGVVAGCEIIAAVVLGLAGITAAPAAGLAGAAAAVVLANVLVVAMRRSDEGTER